MRGVSHAHTWYPAQTSSFADIKALGANAVRVVLQRRPLDAERAADVANIISPVQGQQAHLRAGGPRHHRLRRAERRASRSTRPSTTGSAQERARSARRTTSSSTSATSPSATTPPRRDWTAATAQRDHSSCAAPASQHTIMVDAPNWGQDWQFTMRDNARDGLRRRPAAQHRLLDPHVRRVRHRRRDQRLPRRVRQPRPAARGRRVRLQPLRRQPRRGHHHGRGPVAAASATSAGRGAATAAASSTSTW